MMRLIGLIKPLLHVMAAAIILGVVGFLCAIGITVLGSLGVTNILGYEAISIKSITFLIIACSILRGILHYGEQACNHYIAFKLLALIRKHVFDAMRRLAPAKMEGRKTGEMISILTSDIELLEVFYAHTISPIAIAIITSTVMLCFIGSYNLLLMGIALSGYVVVGAIIPLVMGKNGSTVGMKYRNDFATLNSVVYDSLRGVDEIIQYDFGNKQYDKIKAGEKNLNLAAKKLRNLEGIQRGITGAMILIFTLCMFFTSVYLYHHGLVKFSGVLVCTVAMTSSFGPLVALSNLSNNLSQTLASGERVLSILEESPVVDEIVNKKPAKTGDIEANKVTFAYEDTLILKDLDMTFEKGKITGILGKSGSGKSTLLKLIMRFWETDDGNITINDRNINTINTSDLRDMQSYVTQETWLFNDTIRNNIAIAKPNATIEEIKIAANKAGIGEYIEGLPDDYNTNIGELGDSLSGGERQRIGVARAFLCDNPIMILDEPTSNLDSLHESYILDSLKSFAKEKTVIIVSHRESTMGIADKVFRIENERKS